MARLFLALNLCFAWSFAREVQRPSRSVFQNDYDGTLDFRCPSTETISRVISRHDNDKEDRRFAFECRGLPIQVQRGHCYPTANFVNEYDWPVAFACDGNGYINGMASIHSNSKEDRRWKFYCCFLPDIHLYDCEMSDWTNGYDEYQDYHVPHDKVMKGVVSVHHNDHEDRIFKYLICSIKKF